MNLLIDICIVFCRIKKNSQVSIYSLAVLNIGHCVELSFLKGKLGGIFVVKVYQSDYKLKTIPICGESTLTFTSKWNTHVCTGSTYSNHMKNSDLGIKFLTWTVYWLMMFNNFVIKTRSFDNKSERMLYILKNTRPWHPSIFMRNIVPLIFS